MNKISDYDKPLAELSLYHWIAKLIISIDKKLITFWAVCNIVLCVLPAVVLMLNQKILYILSQFTEYGSGQFSDVLPYILFYGIVLAISGLSARINSGFLYFRMYDSFYLGMQRVLMDFFQKMPMEVLFHKEVNDEYNAIIRRAGSLTDVTSALCDFLGKGCGVIALLFTAASVSPVISLVIIIYFIIAFSLNHRMTKRLEIFERKMAPAERRMSHFTEMPMQPNVAKEIRVYGNQTSMIEQWEKFYEEVKQSDLLYNKSIAKSGVLSSLFLYIFMSIVLLICLHGVSEQNLSVEQFLMLFTLCGNLAAYVSLLSHTFITMQRGIGALKRQKAFMEMVETANAKKENTSGTAKEPEKREPEIIVKASNLSFSYQNNRKVLHNINLSIPKGQVVALVGENGSGKSTLVQVLTGMYQPTEGTVETHGSISTFFQDFYIFHKTVRENVGIGQVDEIENIAMIEDAILRSEAKSITDKLPNGIDTLLRKEVFPEGTELSGGERQKIGIARALMGKHDLLVFDEPASALDPIAELKQFEQIKKSLNGSTAILISHRIGFAQLADRILVLKQGRIVEDGTHQQLIEKNGLYARMFHEQAQWYRKEES